MSKALTTAGVLVFLLTFVLLSGSVTSDKRNGDNTVRFDRQQQQQLGRSAHNHQLIYDNDDDEGNDADYNGAPPLDQNGGEIGLNRNDDSHNSGFLKGLDGVEKRNWSRNNVRIWGKRGWSSKGLRMWGKRSANGTRERSESTSEDLKLVEKWANRGRWTNGLVGRDTTEDKRKWSDAKLKIWGKRRTLKSANEPETGNRSQKEGYVVVRGTLADRFPASLQKRNSPPNSNVEQKYGKKGWANNNVRIWG